MKPSTQAVSGVFQYFYHCTGEELPVRDVCNRQGHDQKTEPHYENLTENWCSRCMNRRIKSANRRGLKYLFLVTRYKNASHPLLHDKLLVVGYLYRAEEPIWRMLSQQRVPSKVDPYDAARPHECGFFVGDESKSHFVRAEDAWPLKGVKNGRWKYLASHEETERIVAHLKRSKNILPELRLRVSELAEKPDESDCENPRNRKRRAKC